MPQTHRPHGGAPAETDICIPPSTKEDQVLSRLNKNYRLSKAQQILRLLKDQDALNQRFRDCDLLEDDTEEGRHERRQDDDEDAWSLQEEKNSEGEDSDLSENEAERQAARCVALRKHRSSIDPGRCKTSMGFYNQAEVSEMPYDTDSDNVAGLDSDCSTPRGGDVVTDSSQQPAKHTVYGQAGLAKSGANSRTRMYPVKTGDSGVRELVVPDEHGVQSARSSRPKTSLTTSSSARSRYYRQQPHPDAHFNVLVQHSRHNPVSQQLQPGSMGETRQAIISRLDPHHPMAVRPFCESRIAPEAARTGAESLPSEPTTPRGSVRHQGNASHFSHTAVKLYDMASSFSREAAHRSSSRRTTKAVVHSNTTRSSMEPARVVPATRTYLSIDSSPLQLGDLSPRGRLMSDDPNTSRRPRSTRVKKRVGEIARDSVPTAMHMLGERAHQSMAVMKLPPLETAVTKGSSGRDMVCVGKD